MFPRITLRIIAMTFLACYMHGCLAAAPATVAFQGILKTHSGGSITSPAGGTAVTFSLYTAPTGGSPVWTENQSVAATNGLFVVSLGSVTTFASAGIVFDKPYWVGVKITGEAAEMTPRFPLESVPFALGDWNLGGNSGTTPASDFLGTADATPLLLKANGQRGLQLEDRTNATGVRSINVLAGSPFNTIDATVIGSTVAGGGISKAGAALAINEVHGDFGVIGGGSGNFVDVAPNVVIAGGTNNIAQGNTSVIGGGSSNNVQGSYSTVAGGKTNYSGGDFATVAGGSGNQAAGNFSAIGGGLTNTSSAVYGSIGGGNSNQASGDNSTVAGGSTNVASGGFAAIGGGSQNHGVGFSSTVAGGQANIAGAASIWGDTVGGGISNQAIGGYAVVSGGTQNYSVNAETVVAGGTGNYAQAPEATVGGGSGNYASASWATVPGGYSNYANGTASFAAGNSAVASYNGDFVWSDDSADSYFAATNVNQFAIRAHGGLVLDAGGDAAFYTGNANVEQNRYLTLLNSPVAQTASGLKAGGILCASDFSYASPGKSDLITQGKMSVGFNYISHDYNLAVNGPIYCTFVYQASDARFKENIHPINNSLAKVLNLKGVSYQWNRENWKTRNFPPGRQIGLLAQDVEKVLPEVVGTDEHGYKSVAYQNIIPVLVEAVKALKADNDAKAAQIARLKAHDAAFEARLQRLERRERLDRPVGKARR